MLKTLCFFVRVVSFLFKKTDYPKLDLQVIKHFERLYRNIHKTPFSLTNKLLLLVKNKVYSLTMHHKRYKLDLINGLGSAISWLKGNMAEEDKDHYDKVIHEVESNNFNIKHKVEGEIKTNNTIEELY